MPTDQRQPSTSTLTALATGSLQVIGRLPSSNFTFLVDVGTDEAHLGVDSPKSLQAVYKPLQGEQNLWDFPAGVYRREVAAYELSVALGWPMVPETIERADGPFGAGSLQRFVEADFTQHYFSLMDQYTVESPPDTALPFDDPTLDQLRQVAVFDLIANNADRKSGHCLTTVDGTIYAIDNGLCFHRDPKLRTVIWDFAGETIARALLDDIRRVAAELPPSVTAVLDAEEAAALQERMHATLADPVLPAAQTAHDFPWPLI